MDNSSLVADCSSCAALCCVSFAFEHSEGFGMQKAPATACQHLRPGGLCGIYGKRADHGMSGCNHYTCHGAGPFLTQALFEGRSWQDDPKLLIPMVNAFLEMARVQMVLATARLALERELPNGIRKQIEALITDLVPDDGWSRTDLDSAPSFALERRLQQALSGLSKSEGVLTSS